LPGGCASKALFSYGKLPRFAIEFAMRGGHTWPFAALPALLRACARSLYSPLSPLLDLCTPFCRGWPMTSVDGRSVPVLLSSALGSCCRFFAQLQVACCRRTRRAASAPRQSHPAGGYLLQVAQALGFRSSPHTFQTFKSVGYTRPMRACTPCFGFWFEACPHPTQLAPVHAILYHWFPSGLAIAERASAIGKDAITAYQMTSNL
jgi:hypothetical protein